MAVVVEQTIPFSPSSLDLDDPSRWNTLFPLIRPSIKNVRTSKGQDILVDTNKANGNYVHIITVGKSGHFSSQVLDGKQITAVITTESGAGVLHATDIPHTLETAGIKVPAGVVLVRAGKERRIMAHQPDVIEIETDGELEQDHVLQLLSTATETTRTNPHHVSELLKGFVKSASSAHSTFHTEKAEGSPAVLHTDGVRPYEKAKHAIERDLKHAMKAHAAQEEVVYSVHFSDVNGLSRLENYIIAGEIAKYFDAQNIKHTLSHSTLLSHASMARGFSISICPLPIHFLAPSPTPKKHIPTGAAPNNDPLKKTLSPTTTKITFNDTQVRQKIEAGCNAVIKAETTITEYDTIVGDGDCGYTLRDGARQVLSFISTQNLTHLPSIIADLVSELEVNMGGTSGALYCIFLSALASSLASEESVPAALQKALGELCKYTNARVGDRTIMDALIPFVETLVKTSGDAREAVEKARQGVEGTKKMEAKLGRSAYLDESALRKVPDPGAFGLLVLLEGMSALKLSST